MKIAVNAQKLVKGKMEGLGWFAYENLKRIVRAHPEHDFTFIFGKGIEQDFIFAENVKTVNIGPPFFRPLAWLLKFGLLMPWYVNRNRFDLYLSPDGWSSNRIKAKKVGVIHDINFEHFPEFLQKSFCTYYRFFFRRWAKKYDRMATVSEYSKQDIIKTYGVPADKIDVVYNGSSNLYQPISEEKIAETRAKYTEGSPYFIFVGAFHPRKNIINLFKAFDAFKITDKQNIKLVMVGERFYWNKATEEVYTNLKFKQNIIFTGRLEQDELKNVYGAALALSYVSLFEGFGIPLVEAMNSGIPIITSSTASMPEIVGDAALIVNPKSVDEIATAMTAMATNTELRKKLIVAGNQRKIDFSWDKTADRFWKTIEKALL